ncbi:NmrA family protein [Zopfia rhizophila CBS 207.26]|uniref:NmrA family protein n=1 Tax=Zopfia rhizophila CBS 207.26 TaxID=1314779 RepID=A0A6A6DDG8_9PEZI|nr:NmrA family protein [Zopfia rhizophila CBS 207.26]
MPKSVLVAAGTGKQGRVVARELLERGHAVHILTRNPSSDTAKELQSMEAVLHAGDLGSAETIQTALDNVDAIFLAIPVNPANPAAEIAYAKNVLEAARNNGVKNIIYSSVARTGEHESFPGWNDDYPMAWYWKNKDTIEHMVRTAGIEHWTILRPAFFIQNFCRPEVEYMFPGLADAHELRVAFNADTQLDLIDVSDIAKFAAAALGSPSDFSGKEITLAAEKLTAAQIAELLSTISGEKITVDYINDNQAITLQKQGHIVIEAQLWQRDVGYGVDIESLKRYGVPLTLLSKALDQGALKWLSQQVGLSE